MRRNIIQVQGPAVVTLILPATPGQPEDSPQAPEVTVGELSQADVNVALGIRQIFSAC